MDYKKMTAPCGLDCFNCQLFEQNITEETKNAFSKFLRCPPEDVKCLGCKEQGGCRLHFKDCATYDCVSKKNLDFCSDCDEFPCGYFMPAADQADKYPHNYKLYNLCRIKNFGFESWLKEAGEIRERYYKGKFKPGKGPVFE
jgi:hypothetical protein